MAQVPDYEEFKKLAEDVAILKEENSFLRAVVLAKKALSRRQVLKVLDISETTLWRLTKSRVLVSVAEGKQTFFDIDSVKAYLTAKKFSKKVVENKLIDVLYDA